MNQNRKKGELKVLVLAERKLSLDEINRMEELYLSEVPLTKKEIDRGLMYIGLVLIRMDNKVEPLTDLDGHHPFYDEAGSIKKEWSEGKLKKYIRYNH